MNFLPSKHELQAFSPPYASTVCIRSARVQRRRKGFFRGRLALSSSPREAMARSTSWINFHLSPQREDNIIINIIIIIIVIIIIITVVAMI
jgi:hypothetical protein